VFPRVAHICLTPAQERDKMLGTIAEMDAKIGATLQFAREESAGESRRPTDLVALLHSVVDDMRDAGLPVCLQAAPPIIYECHAAAVKRALRNLLDNAVKYGKSGTVQIRRAPKAIEIVIDDEGPGIPEPGLACVLEPFYRLDDHLDAGVTPTVVLMNSPFSALANVDRRRTDAAFRHVSSGLARLADGGRLVAVTQASKRLHCELQHSDGRFRREGPFANIF
jgi:hypothetical protein